MLLLHSTDRVLQQLALVTDSTFSRSAGNHRASAPRVALGTQSGPVQMCYWQGSEGRGRHSFFKKKSGLP